MSNQDIKIDFEEFSGKLASISENILNNKIKTAGELKQRIREELSYEELILLSSNTIFETVEKFKRDNPIMFLKQIFEEIRKREDN